MDDHHHEAAVPWSSAGSVESDDTQVTSSLVTTQSLLDASYSSYDASYQSHPTALEEGLLVEPEPEPEYRPPAVDDLMYRRAAPPTIWSVVSSDDDSSCNSSDSSSSRSTKSSISSSEPPFGNPYFSRMSTSRRGLSAVVAGSKTNPTLTTGFPAVSLSTTDHCHLKQLDENHSERETKTLFMPYVSTTETTTSSSDEELDDEHTLTDDDDDGIPVIMPDSPYGSSLSVDIEFTEVLHRNDNEHVQGEGAHPKIANPTRTTDDHDDDDDGPVISPYGSSLPVNTDFAAEGLQGQDDEHAQGEVDARPKMVNQTGKSVTWRSPITLYSILEEATEASDFSTADTAYSSSAATAKSPTGRDELTLSSRETREGTMPRELDRADDGAPNDDMSVFSASEPSMLIKDKTMVAPHNEGTPVKNISRQSARQPHDSRGSTINKFLLVRLGSVLSSDSSVTYSEGMFTRPNETDGFHETDGVPCEVPHEDPHEIPSEAPYDEKKVRRQRLIRLQCALMCVFVLLLLIVIGSMLGLVLGPKGDDADSTSYSAMASGFASSPTTEPSATPSTSPTGGDFNVLLSVGLFFGEPVAELEALSEALEGYLTETFETIGGFHSLEVYLTEEASLRDFSQATLIAFVMNIVFDATVDRGVVATSIVYTCEFLNDVDGIQAILSQYPLLDGLTYKGSGGSDCEGFSPGSSPAPALASEDHTNYPTANPLANSAQSPMVSSIWDPTTASTVSPTSNPSKLQVTDITDSPTVRTPPSAPHPTIIPTAIPSWSPSQVAPTSAFEENTKQDAIDEASSYPSLSPTQYPVWFPTHFPTRKNGETSAPSHFQNAIPVNSGTSHPVGNPTKHPTHQPEPQSEAPEPLPTDAPTLSPTPNPTAPEATPVPKRLPTAGPTISPTPPPTENDATPAPVPLPTENPTVSPTSPPTENDTTAPTVPVPFPTKNPTLSPTSPPSENDNTAAPTPVPVPFPTKNPTLSPTSPPSENDGTAAPTPVTVPFPTESPTLSPTSLPTEHDTAPSTPALVPMPNEKPTLLPTPFPVAFSTSAPTLTPVPPLSSAAPTLSPTTNPPTAPVPHSASPAFSPTLQPAENAASKDTVSPAPTLPLQPTHSSVPSGTGTPSCLAGHPVGEENVSSPAALEASSSLEPSQTLVPTATPVPTKSDTLQPSLDPVMVPSTNTTSSPTVAKTETTEGPGVETTLEEDAV